MSNVVVVGGGAWGSALAVHCTRAGLDVALVPGRGLGDAAAGRAILVAVPMQHLRGVLPRLSGAAPLVLCCKGIETGRGRLPLEVTEEIWPGRPAAVLTGPNFAHEIAAGLPAAGVLAAADAGLRGELIALLGTPLFRLYGNDDVVGAQLGGAAKNVIAIAAGAVIGAGYGENARAALVTRGLAELSRLIVALGGRAETASGLSGMGDLVLTCTGVGSRNFAYGLALGRGERPSLEMGVVEGVATAPALIARATGVDLPICSAVADVLAGKATVKQVLAGMMSREVKEERVLF